MADMPTGGPPASNPNSSAVAGLGLTPTTPPTDNTQPVDGSQTAIQQTPAAMPSDVTSTDRAERMAIPKFQAPSTIPAMEDLKNTGTVLGKAVAGSVPEGINAVTDAGTAAINVGRSMLGDQPLHNKLHVNTDEIPGLGITDEEDPTHFGRGVRDLLSYVTVSTLLPEAKIGEGVTTLSKIGTKLIGNATISTVQTLGESQAHIDYIQNQAANNPVAGPAVGYMAGSDLTDATHVPFVQRWLGHFMSNAAIEVTMAGIGAAIGKLRGIPPEALHMPKLPTDVAATYKLPNGKYEVRALDAGWDGSGRSFSLDKGAAIGKLRDDEGGGDGSGRPFSLVNPPSKHGALGGDAESYMEGGPKRGSDLNWRRGRGTGKPDTFAEGGPAKLGEPMQQGQEQAQHQAGGAAGISDEQWNNWKPLPEDEHAQKLDELHSVEEQLRNVKDANSPEADALRDRHFELDFALHGPPEEEADNRGAGPDEAGQPGKQPDGSYHVFRGVPEGQDPLMPGHGGATFGSFDKDHAETFGDEVHLIKATPRNVKQLGSWEEKDRAAEAEWKANGGKEGDGTTPKYKDWADEMADARREGYDAVETRIGGRHEIAFLHQEGMSAMKIDPEQFDNPEEAEAHVAALNEYREVQKVMDPTNSSRIRNFKIEGDETFGGMHHVTWEDRFGRPYNATISELDNGKHLHVNWVGKDVAAERNAMSPEQREAAGPYAADKLSGSNTLGVGAVRELKDKLAAHFPNAETVGGERISGVHAEGKSSDEPDTYVTVPLRNAQPEMQMQEGPAAGAGAGEGPAGETPEESAGTPVPQMTKGQRATMRKIFTAMKVGAHPSEIVDLLSQTDAPWPYALSPEHLKNWLGQMSDLIRGNQGENRIPLADQVQMGREIVRDLGFREEAVQGFLDIPPGVERTARIQAVKMYMTTLGNNLLKLESTLRTTPDSPVAQSNFSNAANMLFHVYSWFTEAGSNTGRDLAAFGDEAKNRAKPTTEVPSDKATGEAATVSPEAAAITPDPTVTDVTSKQPGEKAPGETPTEALKKTAKTDKNGKKILDFNSLTDEQRETFMRMVRMSDGDPKELMEMVRQQTYEAEAKTREEAIKEREAQYPKPTTLSDAIKREGRIFKHLSINGMISGTGTIGKILASQTFMTAKLAPEFWVGGALQMLKGDVPQGLESMRNGSELAMAQMQNINTSIKAMARAFKADGSHIDPFGGFQPDGGLPKATYELGDWKFMNTAVGLPARMHMSITEFSKTMNYRAMVQMRSLEMSRNSGLSASATAEALSNDLAAAFDPNGKAIGNADALYEARRATFTLPLQEGTASRVLSDALAKNAVMKYLLNPFLRISTNIFREGWSMTPGLASFQGEYRAKIAEGGEVAARAEANMVMGGAMITGLLGLVASGKVMGRYSGDATLRQQKKDAGEPENAMSVGDRWYSFNRMEPLATPLKLATSLGEGAESMADIDAHRNNMAELHPDYSQLDWSQHPVVRTAQTVSALWQGSMGTQSEDGIRAATGAAAGAANLMLNETAMKGMLSFMDMFDGEQGSGMKLRQWLAREAATIVPGSQFWKSVNSDPVQREANTLVESLMENVPGLSSKLEPHRNDLGEKQMLPPGFQDWQASPNHINPFGTTKINDPVALELLRLGKAMPSLPKAMKGTDGVTDIDLTDRNKWDQSSDATDSGPFGNAATMKQSPFDRQKELMSTPIFQPPTWIQGINGDKKMNAREVLSAIVKSKEYQAIPEAETLEPGGRRYMIIARAMKDMQAEALYKMMDEPRYANLKREVMGLKAVNKMGRKGVVEDDIEKAYRDQLARPAQGGVDSLINSPTR